MRSFPKAIEVILLIAASLHAAGLDGRLLLTALGAGVRVELARLKRERQ